MAVGSGATASPSAPSSGDDMQASTAPDDAGDVDLCRVKIVSDTCREERSCFDCLSTPVAATASAGGCFLNAHSGQCQSWSQLSLPSETNATTAATSSQADLGKAGIYPSTTREYCDPLENACILCAKVANNVGFTPSGQESAAMSADKQVCFGVNGCICSVVCESFERKSITANRCPTSPAPSTVDASTSGFPSTQTLIISISVVFLVVRCGVEYFKVWLARRRLLRLRAPTGAYNNTQSLPQENQLRLSGWIAWHRELREREKHGDLEYIDLDTPKQRKATVQNEEDDDDDDMPIVNCHGGLLFRIFATNPEQDCNMDLDVDMNTEVFETPDPEVTFQAYAAVSASGSSSQSHRGPEDAHYLYDKSHSEIDEDAVAPTKAFEAFMGKVYKPTPRLSKQTEYESTGGLPSTSASLATLSLSSQQSKKQELESPLTRFTRLTMEIKELEADLTLLAKNADAKKAKLLVDAAQEAEYEEVMEGLATLQSNLAAIEQNAAFQPFLHHGPKQINAIHGDKALALQKELTSKFFKQIEALKAQQQGKTSVASSAGGETATPIVYEIYSNGELNAIDKDAKTRTLALESRIATLEKAIGNFHVKELRTDGLSGLSTSGADLLSVITQLEKRVNLLNEKNLDSIKTRTTALIHEFTLLNKLKESPSVQGALNSHADREKIQQIYDKLKSIDDVSGAVPALVDRLVTLKSIHDESLDMTARVKKVEQANETLSGLLETDTALLENIEKSLAENVKIFQSNIQTLDERMATLVQSK